VEQNVSLLHKEREFVPFVFWTGRILQQVCLIFISECAKMLAECFLL